MKVHNNDEETVDAIIAEKYETNQWRANKDAPRSKAANQFWVIVKEDVHNRRKKKKKVRVSMSADLDGEGAQAVVGPKLDWTGQSGPSRQPTRRACPLAITNLPSANLPEAPGPDSSEKATVSPDVQTLIDKEQARLKNIADSKAAREDQKENPLKKAERWIAGIDRELQQIKGTEGTILDSIVPQDTA